MKERTFIIFLLVSLYFFENAFLDKVGPQVNTFDIGKIKSSH